MKLKVRDIIRAKSSMERLAETKEPKLKIQPSFWLARQYRKVRDELEIYDLARDALVRELGAPRHEGSNEFEVLPINEDKFFYQILELQRAEVDINIEPRPVAYINQPEYSAVELANMWFLWTDEEPAEEK